MLYFASQYDEALQELQMFKQESSDQEDANEWLDTTLARLSCLLYEQNTW